MDELTSKPAPAHWRVAIEESEADLAAGRLVDSNAVHRRLRDEVLRRARPAADEESERPAR